MDQSQMTDADLLKMVQDEMARRGISTGPKRAGEDIQMSNQINMQMAGNPVSRTERMKAADNADRIAERNMARTAIGPMEAALHGVNSGSTFGFFDEIAGALGGDAAMEYARQRQDLGQTAYPGLTTTTEIGGAVASPAAKLLGTAKTVGGALRVGATAGAVDAAGRAEGSIAERLDDAAIGAATGALFGGVTAGALRAAGGTANRIHTMAQKRPTLENLQAAKNAAYAEVRKSGVEFSADDMTALAQRLARKARTTRYEIDPETDKFSEAALRSIQGRSGEPITLNKLDRVRQRMWDRYNRSEEPFILEVIGEIDGLMAGKAESNELMGIAREANSRFSKARLLESAFKRARLQTAATGSGGNILNKYRQAVVSILNKPHEAKWFSKDELALMESFVEGDNMENALRKAGKLSPDGNGLITALMTYSSIALDPTMLAVGAAGAGAKAAADQGAMAGSEELLRAVSTGKIPSKIGIDNLRVPAVGGAVFGGNLVN